MLYLIGLGLWDEKDITLRGLEAVRNCDKAYLECYTCVLAGTTKEKLEETIGKKIIELDRKAVEEKAEFLTEAREKNIALLVAGDPLVATTHWDLLLRAREKNISYKVIHNASIYSAVAETGLQIYKFGRTATVVFWEDNYKPTSFFDVVRENKERGLHTLLLLDIRPEKLMTPNHAIETLMKISPAFKTEKLVVLSRAGSQEPSIAYGKADELLKRDFGDGPHVLIVTGNLHPMEKEALERLNIRENPKGLNNRSG
ncbi:MAG: diphthine synthase [Candidatus Diapherotrites archaeon]|nr:diphthine synthase [Candidatus Diapherotrites archaeon]